MGKWLESPQTLLFEVRDKIAYVTFNRPEQRNAQSALAYRELAAAMMEADDLKSVHCIVLAGAGKDFCAGADISGAVPGAGEFDPADYRGGRNSYDDDAWAVERSSSLRTTMMQIHKPVIAKVHGHCLAVGTDIALGCDMVIASHDAKIGFPATRALGSPANHMWLYLIGPQWTKRLLMTGDLVTGRKAKSLGLVLDSVPRDQLDAAVDKLAKRIALIEPQMLAAHKRIVNLGLELMGWSTLQRLAAENDARAHLSPAFTEFFQSVKDHGLKEALRRRDAPYGDRTNEPYADSLIRADDEE